MTASAELERRPATYRWGATPGEAGGTVGTAPLHGDEAWGGLHPEDLRIGALAAGAQAAIVVADADTQTIVLWTHAAERLFGYTSRDVLRRPLSTLVPEPLRAEFRVEVARRGAPGPAWSLDACVPSEWPVVRRTGEELAVELSLSRLDEPPVGGRFVVAVARAPGVTDAAGGTAYDRAA